MERKVENAMETAYVDTWNAMFTSIPELLFLSSWIVVSLPCQALRRFRV